MAGPAPIPGAELIRAQLERIAESPVFNRSERLVRFLRFVIDRTLAGEGDGLKEYTIGVGVYDRPDFDPRLDSSVRVDARRLRAKLAEYYAGPGKHDNLRIELPKGTYVPLFHSTKETPPAATYPQQRRRWPWVAATAVALAVLGFVLYRLPKSASPAISGRYAVQSLAVLPFANSTGKAEYDSLCDGMAEEMIDRLSRLRGVRIVSRSSSFAYKGKPVDTRTVARELKVDSVLEGSVRSSGDTLRVTVQLVRGSDASQVWSESFDLAQSNELQVQAAIARIIERRIVQNLPAQPAPSTPDSPEDQQWLAMAKQAAVLVQRRTPESLELALDYASKVAQAMPSHAPAYATMADASLSLADFRRGEAARRLVEEARLHATKAMELEPAIPGPFMVLGMIELHFQRNWGRAEDHFRRALALDPKHAAANARYALLLSLSGKHEEAQRYAKSAVTLAPTSVRVLATAGDLSYFARRYDDAIQELRRALAIDPGYDIAHITIARSLELTGRKDQAMQEVESMSPPARKLPEYAALRAWVDARRSNIASAKRWMEAAQGASCISLAAAHASLGDSSRAFQVLEQAVQENDPAVIYIRVSPSIDPLRADPRLEAVCKKVGLSGCQAHP